TYYDHSTGEEVYQPAEMVILCAYQLHNVHLLLLSGIGKPYDPVTGAGVTGRGYAYQMSGGTTLFSKDKHFNPFIGQGYKCMVIDDYGMNQINYEKVGII